MLSTEADWPASNLAIQLIRPDIEFKERFDVRSDSFGSPYRFFPRRKFVVAPSIGQHQLAVENAEPL
jgi:hypothetical protein